MLFMLDILLAYAAILRCRASASSADVNAMPLFDFRYFRFAAFSLCCFTPLLLRRRLITLFRFSATPPLPLFIRFRCLLRLLMPADVTPLRYAAAIAAFS